MVTTLALDTVTYRPIARQRFGKNIPARKRTSIARQRISKQAFPTTERLCFLRGPSRGIINGQRRSFERVVFQELGRVMEMAAQGDSEEMTRKELGGAKTTSCVICSDSDTSINPLPRHD
jgi:hypothetical protein